MKNLSQFSKISTLMGFVLASLVAANAWASAAQGKPNADCPQFAPAGFPFPADAQVKGRAWHICRRAYSSYVDPATRTPLWSAEKLEGANLTGEEPRTNDFRPDPDIPKNAQAGSSRDFARTGYDQGHLSPAGDFKGLGTEAMSESFYFSNIVPQEASNNRHAWQKLEIFTRQWAQERGVVYVVTGPIYSGGKALDFLPKDARGALAGALGGARIAVPTHMFKVVMDFQRMESVAFVLPNAPVAPEGVDLSGRGGGSLKKWEETLSQYVVSINELEAWTGLRFDAALQESQRAKLHSQKGPMWGTRPSKRTKKGS